jgi:hypothetical protein
MVNIVMVTHWTGGDVYPFMLSAEQFALRMRRLHQKKKQGATP